MIALVSKELCTGCGTCANICPQKCIEMEYDKKGFCCPKTDRSLCNECGLCLETCPSLHPVSRAGKWTDPKVFAAWSLDEKVRFESTSGGVFSELSRKILQEGGLVAAARYNGRNLVEHCMIDTEEDIKTVRQSKYIQSDTGFVYRTIRQKLLEKKLVGFCGAPCQVAGLLNFLGKPYDNLVTFDFVCRGTNSPKAYLKYLEMLEKKYGSKVVKVWFKNKTYGWNRFCTRIDFADGQTYLKDRFTDLFMRGYIEENLYMRPCCFSCKYRSFPRTADITLADFWGAGGIDPLLDPDKGTSLILINSDKGSMLFDSIKNRLFRKESTLQAALPGNGCISDSPAVNANSGRFMELLDAYPFDVCFRKCVKRNIRKRMTRKFFSAAGKVKRKVCKR